MRPARYCLLVLALLAGDPLAATDADAAKPITAARLAHVAIPQERSAPAATEALTRTAIAARLAAEIESVVVEVGDRVAAGATLARQGSPRGDPVAHLDDHGLDLGREPCRDSGTRQRLGRGWRGALLRDGDMRQAGSGDRLCRVGVRGRQWIAREQRQDKQAVSCWAHPYAP